MNPTSNYQLTIIVPIYNEEEGLPALEERLAAYLPNCSVKACVLMVNDGSTDRSAQLMEEVCARHDHMYYISFERNCGLTAALKAGFDTTESPLVGYIDADLQTAPEDFELLLPHTADHELVTGIRKVRNDSRSKRFQSKFANGFRRMMTGDTARDTGCPLKILHTSTARRLPMFKGMHRFIPALVALQEGKMKQVEVNHYPRVAGTSKFSLANRLVGPLMDCFAYRWMRPRWYNYKIGSSNLV